ncbi:hypothetical protein E2C01_015910 [Portunus trituberculatus]|uniref:Uncharacterized protein n=1 Tax=Portunus trituberculatus TaxID=210409 RepID=A0A5B7DPJ9_PORTR|nr:hypothetical protein [Portunus trituberculatus]
MFENTSPDSAWTGSMAEKNPPSRSRHQEVVSPTWLSLLPGGIHCHPPLPVEPLATPTCSHT